MNDPSQEDLLGYVLGALEAPEQRKLQQQIDQQPEIEKQLLAIKSSLVPLDVIDSPGHRPGLARRTCELVASYDPEEASQRIQFLEEQVGFDSDVDLELVDSKNASSNTGATTAQSNSSTGISASLDQVIATMDDQPDRSAQDESGVVQLAPSTGGFSLNPTSWSINELLVGVACMAVLAGILFPVVSWSRYQSRLTACQNNLREVGSAFLTYSGLNDNNEFVSIPQNGNLSASGCYGPILKDAGLLLDDSLLACAGLGANASPVFIPSCKQVLSAKTSAEIAHFQQTMGGHFGYSMGHCENNRYIAPRNGQAFLVLLADRPSNDRPGRVSSNHGGYGQNCLFADGRVVFVKGHSYGDDALFENDYGVVAPGFSERDNVIAPSHLSPAIAVQMQVVPVAE